MPPREPAPTAIIYDFDGTLAPGNIQEHTLIPEHLDTTPAEFWEEVGRLKRHHDADEILVYLWLLARRAAELGRPLTRQLLAEHGERAPLFPGVTRWFDRINEYATSQGLELDHYIISSGNHEMISHSEVAGAFRTIFASRYVYDEHGHATWPGVAINYTTKTQFLFRINKGVDNNWNNEAVNRWQPMAERALPFQRMIYIGDGDTDIPSMKMVRYQGGHSIAVFDPSKWDSSEPGVRDEFKKKAYNLIAEDRAHFVLPADYADGSQLDIAVKGVLGRIAREVGFRATS